MWGIRSRGRAVAMAVAVAVVAAGLASLSPVSPARGDGAGPDFVWRGVVEGYYGEPWSHEAREAQLRWMGEHGLNAYLYAPKDDHYQRANWRDAYPAAELAALVQEVEVATAAGVAWIPNISPAQPLIPGRPAPGTTASRSICFACPGDVDAVVAKLEPFVAAGAPAVAIGLDDVLPLSPHPEDWRAYGVGAVAAARMHRDLLARVHHRLGVSVIAVLTEYSGTRDSPYLRAIRADGGLDPGVGVMWTGTAVVSTTIAASDAAAYARLVGRDRVTIWDNYPVHDMTGPVLGRPPPRLFLGPYEGRDPDLDAAADGVLVDPMQLPLATRIPLATVAEYLGDPRGYDPGAAWARALEEAGGAGVRTLAENSRSSRLDRTESVPYTAAVDSFASALGDGSWPAARTALDAELARERSAPAEVAAVNPGLQTEVDPWLQTMSAHADLTARAADVAELLQPSVSAVAVPDAAGGWVVTGSVAGPRPGAAAAALPGLVSMWAAARARTAVTHGDRLTLMIDTVYVGENRVDRFVAGMVQRVVTRLVPAFTRGSRVAVSVGGAPVAVSSDGSFTVTVGRAGPLEVVATDAAGGSARITVET